LQIMADNETVLVIEAGRSHRRYLKDLWHYRELFWMLAWRDILVRYKQTVIGVAWSVIRPLLTMIVFTVVFGKIAKLPSDGVPYVLMVFAGMMMWQFFSNTVGEGSNSLIANQGLISKVYFPRLIIPSTCMIVSLIDLSITGIIFVPLMLWYRMLPSWQIVFLPLFVVLGGVSALGISYLLTALNVRYRDFRFVIPFVIQFGLYVSPVGFSSSVVPEKWRLFYAINPMVGAIDGVRWSMFNTPMYWPGVLLSVITTVILLFGGYVVFRNMEREFADYI